MALLSEKLVLDPEIAARVPDLVVATKLINGTTVSESPAKLLPEKEEIIRQWQGKAAADLDSIPAILSYREMHRKLQSNSENLMPSVEGMIVRAILKGKFPSINSAVDNGNIVSLKYMVPIGLFDADGIAGQPVLGLSRAGESIIAIGKESPLPIGEGTPVLRDDRKILSLIGVRDSKFTMITPQTKNILTFSWGLGPECHPVLDQALEELGSRLAAGN